MADLQKTKVKIDERIKQIEAKIKNPEKLRLGLEKFSNSLNSLINRLEKGDLVEKDILVRNMVSNLEIDAQKRVIYRYKSPFNFIFEPEFSTGSPVGEGRPDVVARLCMVVDWCIDHPEYTAKINDIIVNRILNNYIFKKETLMALQLTNEWDKVFEKSDKVNHRKVSFKNHFGIEIAADLWYNIHVCIGIPY